MSITSTRQIEATPKVQWIERWAPIAGLVFVALMVVGSSLVGQVPLPDASEREILDYLADGDAHTRNLIGSYLWVFGSLTFLWFLTRLRSDLRRAEGGTGPLTNLAFSAGLVFAAVWMVAAAVSAALANAIGVRGASISDPDLVRVLPPTGRLLCGRASTRDGWPGSGSWRRSRCSSISSTSTSRPSGRGSASPPSSCSCDIRRQRRPRIPPNLATTDMTRSPNRAG